MIQSFKHINGFVTQNFAKEGLDNISVQGNCTSSTRTSKISCYTVLGWYQIQQMSSVYNHAYQFHKFKAISNIYFILFIYQEN